MLLTLYLVMWDGRRILNFELVRLMREFWIVNWAQAASLRQRSPHPRSPSPKGRGQCANCEFWIVNWHKLQACASGEEKLWQTLKVCQSVGQVRLVGEFLIGNWAQAASLCQRSPHPRSPSPKGRGAVRSCAV